MMPETVRDLRHAACGAVRAWAQQAASLESEWLQHAQSLSGVCADEWRRLATPFAAAQHEAVRGVAGFFLAQLSPALPEADMSRLRQHLETIMLRKGA